MKVKGKDSTPSMTPSIGDKDILPRVFDGEQAVA